MNIRAKFRVEGVTKHGEEHTTIRLRAVTTGSEENKKYWKYTPSGDMTMTVMSHVVADFKPDQEYYITLELADSAQTEPDQA